MRRTIQAIAVLAVAAAAACTADTSPSPSTEEPTPTDAPSTSSPTQEASAPAGGSGELLVEVGDTAAGEALVAPDGLTLYIFLNDQQGGDASACSGECAATWPAFIAEEGQEVAGGDGVDGDFATISRENGTEQITYEGWPLYYYIGDAAPGDSNGEGAGGVWFVAPPSGEAPS